MRRILGRRPLGWIVGATVLASGVAAGLCRGDGPTPAPAAPSAAVDGGRVVILGFDGASHDLAKRFIEEGRMPNCAKLLANGTFAPLGSSNPAESPVAWASVNTGQNPGKTNIFGFIRRTFTWRDSDKKPGEMTGRIDPTIGYSREVNVDLPGGGGQMPMLSNDLRCANFWDLLDAAGLESRVLQAACNFPAKAGGHTKLLAGLSVPDVRGGPGTFLVYTNSEWDFDRGTNNGGEVKKFRVICPKCKNKAFNFTKGCVKCADGNKVGYFETRLKGPDNFVLQRQWDDKVQAAAEKFSKADAQGKGDAQKELQKVKNEKAAWEKDNKSTSVPLIGWIDRAAQTIKFELGGQQVTVKEGAWSPYIPVNFTIEGAFPVKATAHLHVAQCNEKADDIRIYLPAITAAADDSPPNIPVTSPHDFGKELVAAAGPFDTIGWSCQTHALKDEELSEASFLSAIWDTIQWRRKLLVAEMAKPDWRTLFQVFGETDRVCHMMYRFFDPKHPQFKAEDAAKTARFGDREIAFKDAIPAIYEEVDRTIGLVLSQIESGALGKDCTLMVCSDHGFSPFREEVELNAWLIDQGFMAVRKDESGAPTNTTSFPAYVDWANTKAYSMGIGTIYINLKGREPDGIVPAEDVVVDGKVTQPGYASVCSAIIEKMLAYKNPNAATTNDPQVFKGAWRRSEYLAGPYAADIRDAKTGRCVEGAADLQVGFNFGYRVAWGTALGDRSKAGVVFPNKSRWSGDHTSVHPNLVRGIFFSTKKMAPNGAPHLQDLAPTALLLLGQPVPADMDGHVIPLAGLEDAATKHQGGTANRESLVPPK